MSGVQFLCQQYEQREAVQRERDNAGYYAIVTSVENLPPEEARDDHVIQRGAAASVSGIGWCFFTAREPALAFGRAARMSLDYTRGYGVYEAAHIIKFCERHSKDEYVLLVNTTTGKLDRQDDEVDDLKRFVQGVKENPWSSMWREPTGYVTELNDGRPVTTRRTSLPL